MVLSQPLPQQPIITPNDSIIFATGDLATIPKSDRYYIRYISSYHIADIEERKKMARLVSFAINSLSTRKKITSPLFVGASNYSLIRVNLQDYDIDPSQWDSFVEKGSGPKPLAEPYFHSVILKEVQKFQTQIVTKYKPTGRYYQNGQPEYQTYQEEISVPVDKKERSLKYTDGFWLDQKLTKYLYTETGSYGMVIRSDWFVVYSLLAPEYYKFLRIGKDLKDFQKLVFADLDLARKARSETKAIVVKSGVARNNRTINRTPTFTDGYYWETHDSLKSVDDRDYLKVILDEKFDASEIIASLPNGLQAYAVTAFNKDKKVFEIQDKADNEVATDYLGTDRIVRTARSCIYCHATGLMPVSDDFRKLTSGFNSLLVADKESYYRIQDIFDVDLPRKIARDQQIYADAIGLATGYSKPTELAREIFNLYEGYFESAIPKQQLARELGVDLPKLQTLIQKSENPHFIRLITQPNFPRRDQFEQGFQDIQKLIHNQPISVK